MAKKTPPKVQNSEAAENAHGSKIDMIKDLIFGENIQEYDTQFETVKDDIEAKKAELEELVHTVRAELNEMIDGLSTDINIRITELDDKLKDRFDTLDDEKVNKQSLGKLLITLGEDITKG